MKMSMLSSSCTPLSSQSSSSQLGFKGRFRPIASSHKRCSRTQTVQKAACASFVHGGSSSSSSSYARRVCAASCDAPLSNDIKDATVVVGVQARRRRTGVVTKCSAAASVPASDATPPAETQQSSSAGSQNTATPTDAIINVVKAIMGAGAFALPWAFTQGGLILTPIALVVSCILSLYSLSMLCRATDLAVTNNLATTESPKDICALARRRM